MLARSLGARTRWVGLGAVAAVVLGFGGLLAASASSSSRASSFVPMTPCRLVDTRSDSVVGPRNTPVGPAETFTAAAWGTNGDCTVPSGATGLSMNVTVVNGTASSFLTVYPADQPMPLSANLNWVAGDPPTPNAVTASLSADGHVAFYNSSGTVDLVVDVVGYYETSASGPAGPTGPAGPAGPAGDPGAAGPIPFHIVWVAKSGGDFTSVTSALSSITDNDGLHPYLIRVAPGLYNEPEGIDLKDYVDIEGSGEDSTTLICGDCGSESPPLLDGSSAVLRATGTYLHSEVRRLTVSNADGASTYNTGIWIGNVAGGVTLDHVTTTALAMSGRFAYGLGIMSTQTTIEGLTASATGMGTTTGAFVAGASSNVVIRGARVTGATSVLLLAPARAAVFDTVFNGGSLGLAGHCYDAVDSGLMTYTCG